MVNEYPELYSHGRYPKRHQLDAILRGEERRTVRGMSAIADKYLVRFYLASCKGKKRFDDPCWALWFAVHQRRKYQVDVHPYKCHFCPGYHLGHVNPRIKMFIQDVIGPNERPKPAPSLLPTPSSSITIKRLLPRLAEHHPSPWHSKPRMIAE